MNSQLKVIIFEEKNIIKNLLTLLDEQYNFIINKDVIKMEKVAKQLDEVAKNLARTEIQRRKIMGNETSLKELVESSNDENIKQAYEDIQTTLKMIEIQKEANEMLIKQRLFFTRKMINCIKPNKGIGTYNAYGHVGK